MNVKQRKGIKMIKAKIDIKNMQKKSILPQGIRKIIRKCCLATLVSENFLYNAEVSVSFIDNREIRILNKQYRDKDVPTDVLSFPLGENGVYDENPDNNYKLLGDVVISLEKAKEQAELYGHSETREIAFLTVHSMLHLLGYDHENGGLEETIMREKEQEILTELGITRD